MFLSAEYATLLWHCTKPLDQGWVFSLFTTDIFSSLLSLIRNKPKEELWVRGGRERELGWDEGGRWGAAFWPSFTLSVLLAGDSVQDLLITTQWSSNPTDLIDSDCCLGLTALPNPPSLLSLPLYLSSQSRSPSPPLLIKHWYAWWPWGPMKEGCWEDWRSGGWALKCVHITTGNSWWSDRWLDTRLDPEVSMSCLLLIGLLFLVLPKMMSRQHDT